MNSFHWRTITDSDYENILLRWWKDWGFPVPPPKECLPDTGILVLDDLGALYAGFIYFTNSSMVWVEWVVSDKNANPERKRGALKFLMDLVSVMTKKADKKYVFVMTERCDFVNSLKKCGFKTGDTNVYQMIKGI